MDKEHSKTLKGILNEAFTDEYIRNTGLLIWGLAKEFYEEYDLKDKVYLNDTIFKYCLIDILVDIARLNHFHDINRVNYMKLIAYTASWWLKRKPFQLIEGCEEDYIYVNEKFVVSILLQASGCVDGRTIYLTENKTDVKKGLRQLYYHLKYRNTDPKTLELFLVGFENGKKVRDIN